MAAANKTGTLRVTLPSDREIRLTRVFNAPRKLIFEAMSKPEHVARWWGPREYTTTVADMDFRVGGAWRFVQRAADGSEFGFRGEYREIVPPERVVQTFEWEGLPGHISVETMTLDERDGMTTLTTTSVFTSVEDRDGMLQSGMEKGASETYDRLQEFVQTLA
jgi:uncharacterized protein YndB with AHSA1/START domain